MHTHTAIHTYIDTCMLIHTQCIQTDTCNIPPQTHIWVHNIHKNLHRQDKISHSPNHSYESIVFLLFLIGQCQIKKVKIKKIKRFFFLLLCIQQVLFLEATLNNLHCSNFLFIFIPFSSTFVPPVNNFRILF